MCYNIFIVFNYSEWRDYSSRERKSKKKRNKGQKIENGNAIVNDVIASLDEAVERVRVANGMIQGTAQSAGRKRKVGYCSTLTCQIEKMYGKMAEHIV